jgi:hypothetical protein
MDETQGMLHPEQIHPASKSNTDVLPQNTGGTDIFLPKGRTRKTEKHYQVSKKFQTQQGKQH